MTMSFAVAARKAAKELRTPRLSGLRFIPHKLKPGAEPGTTNGNCLQIGGGRRRNKRGRHAGFPGIRRRWPLACRKRAYVAAVARRIPRLWLGMATWLAPSRPLIATRDRCHIGRKTPSANTKIKAPTTRV